MDTTGSIEEKGIHRTDTAGSNYEIDKAVERSYLWKLDTRLIPLLSFMYLLCFMDKSNIGNAKTDGLEKDIGLSGGQYSTAVTMLSITQMVFEPWQCSMVKKYGAKWILPTLMFGWGSIAMIQAGMVGRGFGSFICLRLALGFFESGFFSGTVFYMSLFYKRDEMAFRIALFYISATIAGAFSGLFSYGLFQIKHAALKGWQYLFILEGCVTLLVALFAYWHLPTTPANFRYFTEAEKRVGFVRMSLDGTSEVNSKFTWSKAVAPFKQWRLWLFCALSICYGAATGSTGTFLPQIVARLGYSTVKTNLYTVAPNMAGCFATLAIAKSSDYFRERSMHLIGALTLTMTGYIVLAAIDPVHNISVSYFACFLLSMGTYAPSCLVHQWHQSNNLDESGRAFTTGVMLALSNVGVIVTSQLFQNKWAPAYKQALYGTAGFQAAAICIVASLGIMFRLINKKRDKQIGYNIKIQDVPTSELTGYNDPRFRYQY
ncbi:allantoate permease [Exophiala viscosa]|uniref:allantoate permease n=1 Tax=Exophiala viscosa TaxID=2486360 RepID=UPI00219ABB33|nr:allantoate permease [Exophiala viscosa]